ncbi:MAG: hypothetical protein HKO68_17985 [Desulfobacterales bacterium]|nr:hypothetical protein [Deltaproteobacteria bacterium]NNL78224.1 hypothetical protein [Desulfobacterales bacterium]
MKYTHYYLRTQNSETRTDHHKKNYLCDLGAFCGEKKAGRSKKSHLPVLASWGRGYGNDDVSAIGRGIWEQSGGYWVLIVIGNETYFFDLEVNLHEIIFL